jgi:octaprenyl-diphosphate synthase
MDELSLDSALSPVADDLKVVETRLSQWAESGAGGMALPAVSRAVSHIVGSGGKRLRPACLLLAARLGDGPREDATYLAAVVETIHTASLIHDDIVDRSPLRRGTPTVHARWGEGLALLVGDLLYSRLFRRLVKRRELDALALVADTVHGMVLGELAEMNRRDDLSLGEEEYFDIVDRKTGLLFSCATELGARAGGLSGGMLRALRAFGLRLGRAYQVVDDLLDMCRDEGELGKPGGADLRDGKVTLPVIHALGRDRARVSDLFRARDRAALAELVRGCGSLEYAARRAEETAEEAVRCLEGIPGGRSGPPQSACLPAPRPSRRLAPGGAASGVHNPRGAALRGRLLEARPLPGAGGSLRSGCGALDAAGPDGPARHRQALQARRSLVGVVRYVAERAREVSLSRAT